MNQSTAKPLLKLNLGGAPNAAAANPDPDWGCKIGGDVIVFKHALRSLKMLLPPKEDES